MTKPILVVGDSFSALDNVNSHWLRIWAENNGIKTDHYSYPGSNQLDISCDFMSKNIDLNNYSSVFLFPTDLFRFEASKQISSESENNLDIMLKMRHDLTNPYWTAAFMGKKYTHWPIDRIGIFPHLYSEDVSITNLYDNISLRWLLRANYNSYIFMKNHFKKYNITLIVVDFFNQVATHDTDEYIIKWCPDRKVKNYDVSVNHISLERAHQISKDFQNFSANHPVLSDIFKCDKNNIHNTHSTFISKMRILNQSKKT